MISSIVQLAAATPNAASNFTETAQTVSVVISIMTAFCFMIVFVYKNRMLSMENAKDIEQIKAKHREHMLELRNDQRRIEAEVVAVKISLANLTGQMGVKA